MRKHDARPSTIRTVLLVLTIVLFPALAHAWTLAVNVTNTTAGINAGNKATVTVGTVSTDVTVSTRYFYPASTVASVSVTVANIANVESITLDGTILPRTSPVTVIKGAASLHSLSIVYSTATTAPKRDVTITQGPGGLTSLKIGGAVNTGGFTEVPAGTVVEVTAQPYGGYKLVKITVNGKDDTTGTGSTSPVARTFLVDGAFAPNTVTAAFAVDPQITSVNLSVPASAAVGSQIQAVAGASSNVTPINYAYTTTCSGESQVPGPNSIFYFTPTAEGNCTVTVTVTAGAATPVVKTTTVSVASAVAAANYTCTACHSASTPQIVSLYDGSAHAGVTSCQDCHGTIPHGALPAGSICAGCHADTQGDIPGHPFAIVAYACTACHDPHTTADSRISTALPPPHFNTITTGQYPASYVTSRAACGQCHSPATATAAIRQDWAKSGHGATKALAWTVEDFKTLSACVRCHTTTGFIAYSTAKSTSTWGAISDTTKEVLACNGCHVEITSGTLRKIAPVQPYPDSSYDNPELGASNICAGCHSGRLDGNSIKAAASAGGDFRNLAFIDSHHMAAAGLLFKSAGYEFAGKDYTNSWHFEHAQIGINHYSAWGVDTGVDGPCIACHMGSTNTHTFSPVTKDSSGLVTAVTSPLCNSCHTGSFSFTADNLNTRKAKFDAALLALQKVLESKGIFYADSSPYFFRSAADVSPNNAVTDWGFADTMGAAFNFHLLKREPGGYAHNMVYARRLLYDSIDYADNGVMDLSVVSTVNNLTGLNADQMANAIAFLTRTGMR